MNLVESRLEQQTLGFPALPSTDEGNNSYSREFKATATGDSTFKVTNQFHAKIFLINLSLINTFT